jgi:P-type E1-E2 ATPase
LIISYIEWSNEQEFREFRLKELLVGQKINVFRDSVVREMFVKDIVVGDICHINSGNLIPTDGIVLESIDLIVDESTLTGESELIRKDGKNSILYSGFFYHFCVLIN